MLPDVDSNVPMLLYPMKDLVTTSTGQSLLISTVLVITNSLQFVDKMDPHMRMYVPSNVVIKWSNMREPVSTHATVLMYINQFVPRT
jgi:hypothetical protein